MTSGTQQEALAEVADLSPDVRPGQRMAHHDFLGEAHFDRSLGPIDDDELRARVPLAPATPGR